MNIPQVSVIIPTYNAEQYIQTTLSSILKDQRIPIEIIVVNDGSTDLSVKRAKIIDDPRIHVVNNVGKGIARAINTGLDYAKGTFVCRCDADDMYPVHRFAWQVNWLNENPDFGAICGNYTAVDSQGNTVVEFDCGKLETEITNELQNGHTRTHLGTFLIRTDLLRKIGGCRTYFKTAEDIDIQLRLSENSRIWYSPRVSYFYRIHGSSITHVQGTLERKFYDQVARTFQIQRKTVGQDDLKRGTPPPIPSVFSQGDCPLTSEQHIHGLLLYRAWNEHQNKQRFSAIATGLRALRYAPFTVNAWTNFLLLIIKIPQQTSVE